MDIDLGKNGQGHVVLSQILETNLHSDGKAKILI